MIIIKKNKKDKLINILDKELNINPYLHLRFNILIKIIKEKYEIETNEEEISKLYYNNNLINV
jgi:hypothetical protein